MQVMPMPDIAVNPRLWQKAQLGSWVSTVTGCWSWAELLWHPEVSIPRCHTFRCGRWTNTERAIFVVSFQKPCWWCWNILRHIENTKYYRDLAPDSTTSLCCICLWNWLFRQTCRNRLWSYHFLTWIVMSGMWHRMTPVSCSGQVDQNTAVQALEARSYSQSTPCHCPTIILSSTNHP